MGIDEQIAILEAFRDGKIIEHRRHKESWAGETLCSDEKFNFHSYEYRVRPELPDTLYLNPAKLCNDTHHIDFVLTAEPTTEDSEQYALVDESKLIYIVDLDLKNAQFVIFKNYGEARTFEKQHLRATSSIKKCLVLDGAVKPSRRKRLKEPEE